MKDIAKDTAKYTAKHLLSYLVVTMLAATLATPALAVDPQGNLSGIWKDDFGNEFMIAQRGNRRISVQYLTDKGNLIWHSATGQGKKEGNKWVLDMKLRLKEGGTKQRQGTVVVGRGVVKWRGGNKWTLLATPGMQIEELQRQLAEAQADATELTEQLVLLFDEYERKNELNRQLKIALAQNKREAAQLERRVNVVIAEYERDRAVIVREYNQLQARYARLLKSSSISGQQRKAVADALGAVQDLAEKAGLEVLNAIGSVTRRG